MCERSDIDGVVDMADPFSHCVCMHVQHKAMSLTLCKMSPSLIPRPSAKPLVSGSDTLCCLIYLYRQPESLRVIYKSQKMTLYINKSIIQE